MANILKSGMALTIGKDFTDAAYAQAKQLNLKSHGTIEVGKRKSLFTWQSTLDIANSEHILRQAAKDDGVHVSLFTSQAIA